MKKFLALSLTAALLAPAAAVAADADCDALGSGCANNLTIAAEVISNCSSLSAGAIDFGFAGAVDTDTDATGTITVTCAVAADYNVELGLGEMPAGAIRRVNDGSTDNKIDYYLYQDSSRTIDWGAGADANAGVGTGSPQNLTVYGRLDRTINDIKGLYSDLVVITLNF